MNVNMSRRGLLAVAAAGALGAGGFRAAAALAQGETTSPFTFPNGVELSWVAPWSMYAENYASEIVASSAALQSGNQGELIVGYHDAPSSIDDTATAILTLILQDPSLAPNVAGGQQQSVGADGVKSSVDHRVYSFDVEGESWGLYLQLVNGLELTAFVAPVAVFASELASAQQSVMLDGTEVLFGVDGTEVQKNLAGAAGAVASPVAEIGEYTDGSGNVHVTWTNGWTEVSQDEYGIELTDPAQSILIGVQGVPFDGATWEETAEQTAAFYYDDQGADAAIVGPLVTTDSISLATDGQYGMRLVQATPSDDPEMYVQVLATNFEGSGAEVVKLLKDVQAAILVNGEPPLKDLDQLIDTSAD